MTAKQNIEAEGDKPKVEKTRHHFAALIAGLRTSQEYAIDIEREMRYLSDRLKKVELDLADARSGLRYIEQRYGRLDGVGWDRVLADEWVGGDDDR